MKVPRKKPQEYYEAKATYSTAETEWRKIATRHWRLWKEQRANSPDAPPSEEFVRSEQAYHAARAALAAARDHLRLLRSTLPVPKSKPRKHGKAAEELEDETEDAMTLLDDFRIRYAGADFPHQEELFGGLLRGEWTLESAPDATATQLTCRHFLGIYQVREKHLRRFVTAHAQALRQDVISLCLELQKTPDEPVHLWGFVAPPHHGLDVFEGATSRRILGCVVGVDARLVSPEEWTTLWGE